MINDAKLLVGMAGAILLTTSSCGEALGLSGNSPTASQALAADESGQVESLLGWRDGVCGTEGENVLIAVRPTFTLDSFDPEDSLPIEVEVAAETPTDAQVEFRLDVYSPQGHRHLVRLADVRPGERAVGEIPLSELGELPDRSIVNVSAAIVDRSGRALDRSSPSVLRIGRRSDGIVFAEHDAQDSRAVTQQFVSDHPVDEIEDETDH